MKSVDFSTGDKIIQWRFPNANQNSLSLNFVKKILEIITSTVKFNNCNSAIQIVGRFVSCDDYVRVFDGHDEHFDEEILHIDKAPNLYFYYMFDNNYNLTSAQLENQNTRYIIKEFKIENENCEYGVTKQNTETKELISNSYYNGKCDNLLNKVKKLLRNSAQTTYTPPASDSSNNAGQSTHTPPATQSPGPSSNAGPTTTTPTATSSPGLSSNAGPTTTTPTATPSSAPSSNAGQTPQTAASPNNAGQTPQAPTATPSPDLSSNAGQTPQPSGSPSNNPPAQGNGGQSNTGPQNSNPPPTPNHNRSFVLLGGTAAVIGGGLAYAGYKARQAQAQKTKGDSTQSLQYSTNLRA